MKTVSKNDMDWATEENVTITAYGKTNAHLYPARHVHLTIIPYTNYSRPIAYSIRKTEQNTKT